VLALAPQESKSGCCDTRSVLWNRICRDLAHERLHDAALAVDAGDSVEFEVLECSGRHPSDALVEEVRARGADEIVLAGGLGRSELRRLRRRSTVPVN
jgi:nucleotide-binding universal stress UspA family protein